MTLFAIFDPRPGQEALPVTVPERFSWFAALLPPVYFVAHGLWPMLALFVIKLAGIVALSVFAGGAVAFWLYVLVAAWFGASAPSFRRQALGWAGWTHRGDRVAPDAQAAQLWALETRP
jgi:hypothetical protein